jgi:predicted nuclease with TOPRIM domain
MYRWLIIVALMTALGSGAFYYYNTTQNTIRQLVSNNATLEANVQTIEEANEQTLRTIDALRDGYQEVQENYSRLENEFRNIRSQNNLLADKFESSDLGKLAAAKPKLIETIINNASNKALRCFELLSGSPLTVDERNAKDAKDFNSECPFLWPGDP